MPFNHASTRILLTAACVLAISGCAGKGNIFSSKKNAEAKPAKLVEFTPSAQVGKLWTVSLGGNGKRTGVTQQPVVDGGQVFAAAGGNSVRALDLQTGKAIWNFAGDKSLRLAGGPGVGEGLVVVGGLDGQVIALDRSNGAERWKAHLANEVIGAPAVGEGMVFVRSNDGRVTAFDAASGSKRWDWRADMPALSVRGNGGLTLGPGHLFLGTDSGRLVALSTTDGSEFWSGTVAQPEGRSELDRMNDVDGTPVLAETTLFASSYKPQTVAVDAPSGRVMWLQEHGGVGGVAVGPSIVATTDRKDVVWGLDRNSGGPMWQYNALSRRGVSAPAMQGDYVVVGDYDGYLHWLRATDGQIAARQRLSSKRIRSQPVVADGVLLAQDVEGNLGAYRVGP